MTIIRVTLALVALAAVSIATPGRPAQAYTAQPLEYGASVFVLGQPNTTARDLDALKAAGLTWAKIIVPWKSIEGACNDCYDFGELDRVVNEANARGIHLIARIDEPPAWATTSQEMNPPPDNPEDYADIVSAVVAQYGSAKLPVIQVWNEPNLSREWGGATIDEAQAQQYVHMLQRSYQEAKKKDPNITIISAGLSPGGTQPGRDDCQCRREACVRLHS